MSLYEELRATVNRAQGEVIQLRAMLSGSVEKVDELLQLYATDLAESANDSAQQFGAVINEVRQDLGGVQEKLYRAEDLAGEYLSALG